MGFIRKDTLRWTQTSDCLQAKIEGTFKKSVKRAKLGITTEDPEIRIEQKLYSKASTLY
jgi:hypothetical protein